MIEIKKVLSELVRDIEVGVKAQIDDNFRSGSFYGRKWPERKWPRDGGRALLVKTGALKHSIRSRRSGGGLTISSDRPYSTIHNEGGEIKVTGRMKRYFWARYLEATGRQSRRKDGSLRRTKKNRELSEEAGFWKAMALKKTGSVIRIPERRFMGPHRRVTELLEAIADMKLTELLNRHGVEEVEKFLKMIGKL